MQNSVSVQVYIHIQIILHDNYRCSYELVFQV